MNIDEPVRRALCDLLDRLGADGSCAFMTGGSAEELSDDIFGFVREEQDRIEVARDNALNKLDVANEVIGEVRGVCKAGDDELTVVAVRRVARLVYAAEKFSESLLPVVRAPKPTDEEVAAWGREFEASAVRRPRPKAAKCPVCGDGPPCRTCKQAL